LFSALKFRVAHRQHYELTN